MFLRQSTASQEILLGPFLDDTDGRTAETALTIANTDIKIFKHGATSEASKNSGGATHIAAGRYYAVLDATDTDTIGMLEVNVHVAGALPVRRFFSVLHANVYDSIFGSTALSTYAGGAVASVTGAVGSIGAGGITAASIATDAITSAKIADGAITAAKIATDAIGAAQLAADAVTEIQSGLSTLNAAGVRSAVGLASANLDTQLDAIPTAAENAAAVWDEPTSGNTTSGTFGAAVVAAGSAGDPWSTTLPGAYGAGTAGKILGDNLDATVSSRASQTSVDTIDDLLDTDVAAIKAKTDLIPSDPADASDLSALIDALPTAAENAAAVLAAGDVDGYSLEETLKLCLAALAGKVSGAATTTIVFRAADDSKARLTATVDADGNRSAITLDETG